MTCASDLQADIVLLINAWQAALGITAIDFSSNISNSTSKA